MKQPIDTFNLPVPGVRERRTAARLIMAAGMCGMLLAIGALNGGTALSASAFDAIVTTIQGVLGSTFILFLIMLALLITVWQLAHGGGYRNLTVVLGILAVGLIGPSLAPQIATATGPGDNVALEQPLVQPGSPAH
jgi:fumarate reductase subunit D